MTTGTNVHSREDNAAALFCIGQPATVSDACWALLPGNRGLLARLLFRILLVQFLDIFEMNLPSSDYSSNF